MLALICSLVEIGATLLMLMYAFYTGRASAAADLLAHRRFVHNGIVYYATRTPRS